MNVLPDAGLFAIAYLKNLPLQPETFRNIRGNSDKARGLPVFVAYGRIAAFEDEGIEFKQRAEFLPSQAAPNILLNQWEIAVNLLGRPAQMLSRLSAHGREGLAILEGNHALRISGDQGDRSAVHNSAHMRFTAPQ